MKIVKLNNNFRIYKYHKFEIGMKFDTGYDKNTHEIAATVRNCFDGEAFMWKYYYGKDAHKLKGDWATGYGEKDRVTGTRPYWIYLRKESMLSLVMLSLNHDA